MSLSLTFYFPLEPRDLELLVESHKKDFDESLKDSFSDEELASLEDKIDALAGVDVSRMIPELTFEDFDAPEELRALFSRCRSLLLLQNVPYLETNGVQVVWFQDLFKKAPEFLVEKGSSSTLIHSEEFLREVSTFPGLPASDPVVRPAPLPIAHGIKAPVLPIDFLIRDVYREIERLRDSGRLSLVLEEIAHREKARRLFTIMKDGKLDADSLLSLSGLIPKEFDDNLEKLKFILKKL